MRAERGQALIEVVLLGLLLLVPLLWLLTTLSEVHRGALAASAAAREAGADAVRAAAEGDVAGAVQAAVARAFADHRIDPGRARVRWGGRLDRGGVIEVVVSYPVEVLPLPLFGDLGASVWVNARHVARVDPYRSR